MHHTHAITAIAYRDLIKFLRDSARMVSTFILPLTFIAILGGGFQSSFGDAMEFDYITFVFTGVLAQTLLQLAPYGYSIVVVDDGSVIPEINYIRDHAANVWCLRHVSNLGAGAAVQTGTEFALLKGAKVIVHFDADGQHDPAQIGKFVEPIRQGTCDVVMGSRFMNPEDRELVPPKKRVLLKIL